MRYLTPALAFELSTLGHLAYARLHSISLGCDAGTCPEIDDICAESKEDVERFLCCIAPTCLDSGLEGVIAKIQKACKSSTNQLNDIGCSFAALRARQQDDDDDLPIDIDEAASVAGVPAGTETETGAFSDRPLSEEQNSALEEIDEDLSELLDLVTGAFSTPSVTPAVTGDVFDILEDVAESFSSFVFENLSDFDFSSLASASDILESFTDLDFGIPTESSSSIFDLDDDNDDDGDGINNPLDFSSESSSRITGPDSDDDDDGDGTNVGAIVGSVVGGLVFIGVLLGFLLLHRRRRKRARVTATETSEIKPVDDVAQSHTGDDKIVGVPDHPGSSQIYRKPMQVSPAGPMSADVPAHPNVAQLHNDSSPNYGVGTLPAAVSPQPYIAPSYNDPAPAQLHSDHVQTTGGGNSSFIGQPQQGAAQYYGGSASGPGTGELPANSGYPAPVSQLHGEPALHNTTSYNELAGSSSAVHR